MYADDLFRQTDRAHAVPPRPKVVARELASPSHILPVDPNRRLPLQKPHRVRDAELRGNGQQPMHVIRQRVSFHQLHAVPLTQLPKHSPNPTSDLAEDPAFPVLRQPKVDPVVKTVFRAGYTAVANQPGIPGLPVANHPFIAASQTVISPIWTSAHSYSSLFPTPLWSVLAVLGCAVVRSIQGM